MICWLGQTPCTEGRVALDGDRQKTRSIQLENSYPSSSKHEVERSLVPELWLEPAFWPERFRVLEHARVVRDPPYASELDIKKQ